MALRLGLGPVFAYEWLVASRRWQFYAWRALFIAILLVALAVVYASGSTTRTIPVIRAQALIGEKFFYAIVGTQLALVLLAAPAATAGAVCLDKARGALTHLLVTDLSNTEIVLGKLASRLLPVLGLVLSTLPILALSTLFGGIDPEALTGAFLITIGLAVLGCTLALTLSVWGHKTYEVLLANYLIWTVALLAPIIWKVLDGYFRTTTAPLWLDSANPFSLAFLPYSSPGSRNLHDVWGFLIATLTLSAALALVAIHRIRAVTVRQVGRPQRRRFAGLRLRPLGGWIRWLPGPRLDGNPVLWRECHRKQISRWSAAVWVLYAFLAAGATALAMVGERFGRGNDLAPFVNAFQVSIGLLLFSVSAVTSLAEERVRGSLDVLLACPLSTRSIVWGKWWGAYRTIPRLCLLPGLLAGALALRPGNGEYVPLLLGLILAYGAALTSLGLALATWVSRLGRAVAASVTIYVVATVGWLFLLLAVVSRGPGNTLQGLATGSPWFGPGMMTAEVESGAPMGERTAGFALFWILAYTGCAVVLLIATMKSFDRCLGRVPEKFWFPQRRRPRVRSST
jgi:ABC-type transport system involved in multi-copper enzyme maturation permease subunit